jgi:hypothetical protein
MVHNEVIMRQSLAALLLCTGSLMLAGCDFDEVADLGSSDRYKEDFNSTHKLNAGGRIALESFNGSVEVVGWDRDTVEVTGTKYARREEVMKDIKIDIVSDPGSLRIRVRRPVENNCNCGAKFSLHVPRKAVLDEIVTSNGSIRLESVAGDSRLRTSNGSVRVWSVDGNLVVQTSNGGVDLDKFSGSADLRTSNGRIKATGVKGSFSAVTSNSSVDAELGSIDGNHPVVARTSNGSVNLTLDSFKGNEIRATTSNGSVNLRLPAGIGADLRASTSNGSITSDLEVATKEFSKTHMAGRIGAGGGLIDITTSNGNVRLLKR